MRTLKVQVVLALVAAGCAVGAQAPPTLPVPGGATAGRIWLIFVDDLHLQFRDTGRVRELLTAIARDLLRDGDLFAVGSSGPSALSIGLTPDRTLLEAAIRKTAGAGLDARDILEARAHPGVRNETVYRAATALQAARDLLAPVRDMHGRRKVAIYVSGGYGFEPPLPGERTLVAPRVSIHRITAEELRSQFAALVQDASRASISVFTTAPPGAEPNPGVDSHVWDLYAELTRRNRHALAERTGGLALLDARDSRDIVRRIRDALR